MRHARFDKQLVILLVTLVGGGAMIFASAAFGLVGRGATHISSVVFNHMVLGVGLGVVALIATTAIDYRIWRTYAPYLFGAALLITVAVFLPQIGFEHGGGRRWLSILGFTFQPSETLKIGTVLLAAAYFASIKHGAAQFQAGLVGFILIIALPAIVLFLQPDIGTLGVIGISVFAVYAAAGARMRDVAIVILLGLIAVGFLAATQPYVRDRVTTFLDPSQGEQRESYQIRQSLIAIGSGGFAGRGFGQGIQKFTYLPEPMGDSIYAVAGEELGFIGAATIVALFTAFALRGLAIASRAPDLFGSLLAVGISVYLGAEALINIAAMLGLMPLTGIPLTFISQGGSAMLVSLGSAGILLNISRHRRAR
ncbi:cell division protein FtsW [Candidatus Kaiserbacteria bacterium]|nr:cell division protein FtsW [Candidatus Kaiserbacteria bacterium]